MVSMTFHHSPMTTPRSTTSALGRGLSLVICLFLAFCTGIGPVFRNGGSLADLGVMNLLIAIVAFVLYYGLVIGVQRHSLEIFSRFSVPTSASSKATVSATDTASPVVVATASSTGSPATTATGTTKAAAIATADTATATPTVLDRLMTRLSIWVRRATASKKTLFLTFVLGWIWVPLLLNTAFGADLLGQQTEVNNWLNEILYGNVAYHTGFTQMDVYPIAHYLWPSAPTFLTNQHNIVLTLFYGLVMRASVSAFSTAVPGVLLLGLLQYAFAAFCCAATAHRFFRVKTVDSVKLKALTLGILLFSPMITLSTLALTKSPLSGFVMVWWLGVLYEILHVSRTHPSSTASHLSQGTTWALFASTLMMLITAKYDLYIVAAELVVLLIAQHRRWKTWLIAMALPIVIFEAGLLSLTHTGTIMNGDSVESKSIQIQQIARVAKYSPQSISPHAKKLLDPIFDLDAMASSYFPNDADRVKSSGAADKVTTYKWKTVTAADWENFNEAWLEIGKAAPLQYLDAFCATFYGYFDIADEPYVPLLYYYDAQAVRNTFGSSYVDFAPRAAFIGFLRGWCELPVLGWFFHGNFWVILTLLVLCVEVRRGKYTKLLWQFPLLVQMAVMVAAPANNFDRHMIGIAAMFAFVLLDFLTDCSAPSPVERKEKNG